MDAKIAVSVCYYLLLCSAKTSCQHRVSNSPSQEALPNVEHITAQRAFVYAETTSRLPKDTTHQKNFFPGAVTSIGMDNYTAVTAVDLSGVSQQTHDATKSFGDAHKHLSEVGKH
jgi:hypothetical protein